MAKKQTRRSISVSRTTYERLKAFCETNNISMSQLVETRVNDFLGPNDVAGAPITGAGAAPVMPRPMAMPPRATMANGLSSASGLAPRAFDTCSMNHAAMNHAAMNHAATNHAAPTAPASASVHGGQHSHAGHSGPASPATSASHAPQAPASSAQGVPMTSAAARFAVEPPPLIIKPRQDTAAPKPAEKRPEQIFTF